MLIAKVWGSAVVENSLAKQTCEDVVFTVHSDAPIKHSSNWKK
jgi:hypothetical protein